MANTKKRVLSLLMALVMTLGLLPISALAEEIATLKTPELGETFTADSDTAVLPTNIPEGSYWAGPVKTEAAITGEPTCGKTEHTHVTETSCTHSHTDACYSNVWVRCTNSDHYYGWPVKNNHFTIDPRGCVKNGDEYGKWEKSKTADTCSHDCSTDPGCVTTDMLCENNGCTLEAHTHNTDPTSLDCCYKVIPASYTWTLTAFHVDSVTIRDTIAADGKLVADVEGYAVSYQWYKNGTAIDGATSKTLNAFDDKNNAVVTAPNKYTVVATANGSTATSAVYTAKYYTELMNGSFEKPVIGGQWQQFKNNTEPEMHWLTTGLGKDTHKDEDIELVRNGSTAHFHRGNNRVADGKQCAEVNAEAYGALYQDVLTQPGSTLNWGYSHRGRDGEDRLILVIVNQNDDNTEIKPENAVADTRSNNDKWYSISGTYEVPAGQYVTRFYFAAIDAVGGATMGNLLDKVTFSSKAPIPVPEERAYTINYYVDQETTPRTIQSGNAEVGIKVYPLPNNLAKYESYKAQDDYSEAALTIKDDATKNILNLYFTTPAYTVEYYINSEAAQDKYTEITAPTGAPTGGKALYDTAISQTGIPTDLLANNNKYTKHHMTGDTMVKGQDNVLKVYYDYTAPETYTVNYAWTSGSADRPAGVEVPASDTTTNLAEYAVKDLPALSLEQTKAGYEITGWFTNLDGTGEQIKPGAKTLTGNQTLYAHCRYTEPNTYYVEYKLANGLDAGLKSTLPTDVTDLTLKELRKIAVANPTNLPEGYTFAGWYTDAGHAAEHKFTADTLAGQTDSIILYAYFTYKAPTHPYTVNYELYLAQDGGNYPAKPETVTIVDNVPVTFDALPTLAETYDAIQAYSYKGNSYTKGTDDDDKAFSGTWANDSLVYTIKLYATHYTVGSLKITKNINGLNEKALETLEKNLSFTVTGPKSFTAQTIKYSDFVNGSYTIEGLTPDTYTVKENNAAVGGYALTATGNGTVTAKVAAGFEPAAISITNRYKSQTYEIIFKAGDHGTLKTLADGPVEGTWNYVWQVFDATDSTVESYQWVGTNTGGDKQIVVKINYGEYLQYKEEMAKQSIKPGLTVNAGYTSDSEFYNGETPYDTLATTMTALLGSGKTSITYTAAYTPNENTEYEVKYIYQNAKGSYDEAFTEKYTHYGKTGDKVTVTTEERNYNGLHYVFDENQDNHLSDTVNGNGTTALRVFFKWQAGVTYEYEVKSTQKFPDNILATLTLPKDGKYYDCGVPVTNNGKPTTDDTTDPDGTWTLDWGQKEVPMKAGGITFVGTWTFTPVGHATVKVQFVDEAGNPLPTTQSYSDTKKIGTLYDFTAANADGMKTLVNGKYTYDFVQDYLNEDGQLAAADTDYEGIIPADGLTITRVYHIRTAKVMVEKTYNINQLPEGFKITVRDSEGAVKATLPLADVASDNVTAGKVDFITSLPLGETYTFTESGYSNGAGWSTVLTAQQAEGQHATPRMVLPSGYTMKDLTVNGYSFTATVTTNDLVGGDGVMIAMHNAYSYTAPIVPPVEPDNDPEEGYGPGENPLENIVTPEVPLAELPETEIPLTELPETEVPLAEAPATGDNLAMWIMAAAISGLSLVWLMISGKKREDENAE